MSGAPSRSNLVSGLAGGSRRGRVERVYRELLQRAEAAVATATAERERASELGAFVRALRRTDPAELVRCAWCGRVAAEGHWIDPHPFLHSGLRERLRQNASHGICPDCMDRVLSAADRERRRRRGSTNDCAT